MNQIQDENRIEGFYEIHVKGHLKPDWTQWLENMEMALLDNGEMVLSGILVDQAALMGVLNKLNHLNLTILSVKETKRWSTRSND